MDRRVLIPLVLVVGACNNNDPPPRCGDGVVTDTEQCDDGNTQSGDGCSSTCEFEPSLAKAECWDLIQTQGGHQLAFAVSNSGLVVLAGTTSPAPPVSRGWVVGFSPEAGVAWTLELDEGETFTAMTSHGDGFLGLFRDGSDRSIVELDAGGSIVGTTPLGLVDGAELLPRSLLPTSDDVLLAGSLGGDLWLGRADRDGQLHTLFYEEVPEPTLNGRLIRLVRDGDRIGALAVVQRNDNWYDGVGAAPTNDLHFMIFDEHMTMVSRLVLTGDDEDEDVSLSAAGLGTVGGRWFIAGFENKPTNLTYGQHAWVAAIEDGEVSWRGARGEKARFSGVTGNGTVIFAGRRLMEGGHRRWAIELDPATGALIDETLGADWGALGEPNYDAYVFETVSSPKLYFVGFVDGDYANYISDEEVDHPFFFWPSGIVVTSFDCDLLAAENIENQHLCSADTNANLIGCTKSYENQDLRVVAVASLAPRQCEYAAKNISEWTMTSTPHDVAGVMLHEIGHALGLQHTNRTDVQCTNGFMNGNTPGNHPDGNEGVMLTPQTGSLPVNRGWRRDDLDGLEYLYGEGAPVYETVVWNDDVFPEFPPLESGQRLNGAVRRVASVAGDPHGEQLFVTLDDEHRVVEAILGANGEVLQEYTPVDVGPLGRAWGNPEVVVGAVAGEGRAMVAWMAGEVSTSTFVHARLAIRDVPGGSWAFVDGFEARATRVALGFDPNTSRFLLGTLSTTGRPELSVVSADGEVLIERFALSNSPVFEIGQMVCGQGLSGCTLPFSTSQVGGPSLGRITFALDGDGLDIVNVAVEVFAGWDVYGRVGLAPFDESLIRAHSGSCSWRWAQRSGDRAGPHPDPGRGSPRALSVGA